MTVEEHIAESRDSALTADRLYNEGRGLQGAEIIWCSVKHAINAIAVQRGWRHATYGQKRSVVRGLENEGNQDLADELERARLLHVHSDNGFLSDHTVAELRAGAARLTQRLLAMAAPNG